jgi:hypothetical protein
VSEWASSDEWIRGGGEGSGRTGRTRRVRPTSSGRPHPINSVFLRNRENYIT